MVKKIKNVFAKWVGYLCCFGLLLISFYTETSLYGVALLGLLFVFYQKTLALSFAYVIFCGLFFVWGVLKTLKTWFYLEKTMVDGRCAPHFFLLYNGERGQHSMKHFFLYVFTQYISGYCFLLRYAIGLNTGY